MLKRLKTVFDNRIWKKVTDILFPLVLVWFSLMHIAEGITVTDTGYNYGNFVFFQSLDDMWKFSTYLANVIGAFFVKLPLGETMLGLNLYTGLVKTMVALLAYFLCIFISNTVFVLHNNTKLLLFKPHQYNINVWINIFIRNIKQNKW